MTSVPYDKCNVWQMKLSQSKVSNIWISRIYFILPLYPVSERWLTPMKSAKQKLETSIIRIIPENIKRDVYFMQLSNFRVAYPIHNGTLQTCLIKCDLEMYVYNLENWLFLIVVSLEKWLAQKNHEKLSEFNTFKLKNDVIFNIICFQGTVVNLAWWVTWNCTLRSFKD